MGRVYVGSVQDGGWNAAHEHGFAAVRAELPGLDAGLYVDGLDDEDAAVGAAARRLVNAGARAIIVAAPGRGEAARGVARGAPGVLVVQVSDERSSSDPPNLVTVNVLDDEARYISGLIAGLAVESGSNLGYVAAVPQSEVLRGINAFALGVARVNPSAHVHLRWSGYWSDSATEGALVRELLELPVQAALIAMHQHGPTAAVVAQASGRLAMGNHVDMSVSAPNAVLSGPVVSWQVPYRALLEPLCAGTWTTLDGAVLAPRSVWERVGTIRDRTVELAPVNPRTLAMLTRRAEIQRVAAEELAAFRTGERSALTIFSGTLVDNAGVVRSRGRPDLARLFDEGDPWLAENVIGVPSP
ncbi:MAG: BMP family ABC transporter substrate-binding protein [Chloroflexota bacterium]